MDIEIKTFSNVNNPKSIHGIYPYRGKISAIEAKQVISQLDKKTILDPFCGSGTIVYEGAKHGLNSIGVDLNPIAQVLTAGKINIKETLEEEVSAIRAVIEKAKSLSNHNHMPSAAVQHFHHKTADEIMRVLEFRNELTDYGLACVYGAISLSARGCNHYKWTSSTVGKDINPKRYINYYEKLLAKIKKHYYPLPYDSKAELVKCDARKISKEIQYESVDYVFSSPPYFDCLDYTAYYGKIIMNILEVDRQMVRSNLIQNFSTYESSMSKVLDELYAVMKEKGKVLFVVGDKKVHGKLISGADFFNDLTPFKVVKTMERSYTGSSSQVFDKLNKTQRKEQIVIWEK